MEALFVTDLLYGLEANEIQRLAPCLTLALRIADSTTKNTDIEISDIINAMGVMSEVPLDNVKSIIGEEYWDKFDEVTQRQYFNTEVSEVTQLLRVIEQKGLRLEVAIETQPISVEGKTAIYHPYRYSKDKYSRDFSQELRVIEMQYQRLVEQSNPRYIRIKAKTGSGCTGLARVLAAEGKGVLLFDPKRMTIKETIKKENPKALIVDNITAEFSDDSQKILNKYLKDGGTVIVLTSGVIPQIRNLVPLALSLSKMGIVLDSL
ncbi:hypothetical protein A1QO_04225 [Vibrio genomosp. F10 str. ZF-129]|uniref:Uncharacterized protein n=1 Tax=Vibrio genomosp. F10 str. ZF-129 TaxID=1187848 RepID=A0A1E5BIP6_9VIBR|nr:hypothetical protein [Vibrio genomosp. F10]OEE37319.1 hypothetical protein A1QO_04225 [Vibrio genomosp. F10 str. ZF-129]